MELHKNNQSNAGSYMRIILSYTRGILGATLKEPFPTF
jgi:hypothetical protein